MDEKTIQRIKKLQALAERGVGGEKTTVQKKLAKLLKDNGINSLDELQKEEYEYTIFSYNGKHEIKLLRQCMYKVMGAKSDRTAYKPYGRRQKIGIYCTKAQKIEIELEFETPEAATEGSIRVYDYDGCCIYSYYGKIRINSDGKDGKEIDVEALGYLEGYQEHKEESGAGE